MKNSKFFMMVIVVMVFFLLIYIIWLFARPVEIIAIHKDHYTTKILVKNFPFTSAGQVNWWENNRLMLKSRYAVPEVDQYGRYSVIFWDFGDGYEIEKPEKNIFFTGKDSNHLLCFKDIKVEERCIRKKNRLMTINTTSENLIKFRANGETYYQDQTGKITKGERFITTIK